MVNERLTSGARKAVRGGSFLPSGRGEARRGKDDPVWPLLAPRPRAWGKHRPPIVDIALDKLVSSHLPSPVRWPAKALQTTGCLLLPAIHRGSTAREDLAYRRGNERRTRHHGALSSPLIHAPPTSSEPS